MSSPCRNPSARKWSMLPRTPADRRAAAATCGWPASQAARPSAESTSPSTERTPVTAQAGREAGGGSGERREASFQERVDGLAERVGVVGRHHALGEHVLLQREEPRVEHGPKRARRIGRRRELLARAAGRRSPGGAAVSRSRRSAPRPWRCPDPSPAPPASATTNVLPEPYSPRMALKAAAPVRHAASSASNAGASRSSPTASRSSPLSGTVPRRSAASTLRRRAGLTPLVMIACPS